MDLALGIITWMVLGLIIGALGRFFLPGALPMSFPMTLMVGLAGGLAGGIFARFGMRQEFGPVSPEQTGFAVVGALVVLMLAVLLGRFYQAPR